MKTQQKNRIQFKKVKDFAKVITGGTPSTTKKEYWENGEIPWLPSGKCQDCEIISAEKFITEEGLKSSAARMMPKETVVIALTGATTGKTGILKIEASANQSVTGILPSEDHIPKYLFYYLRTIRKKILNESYGGAQSHISQGYVKNLDVPLPDLETQKQIVAVLEKAEALKQKQKRQLELYNEYLKSIFWEMFLKEKGKWEEKSLNEIANLSMGGTPSTNVESYWKNGNINWMKSGDIKGDFILEIPNRITQGGFKNSNTTIYPVGTVVIALNGQGKTRGTTAILKIETTSNQSVVGIMIDKEKIVSEYLHFNLKLRYEELRNLTGDDARTGLNLTILRNLKIPLPPLPLQKKFADIVEKVEKLKEKQKKSLEDSEELFNVLMQKAFRGELS